MILKSKSFWNILEQPSFDTPISSKPTPAVLNENLHGWGMDLFVIELIDHAYKKKLNTDYSRKSDNFPIAIEIDPS